jgi:hypothetical protein
MSSTRILFDESLWVRGEAIDRTQRNSRSEAEALRARGAKIFPLRGRNDAEGLKRLQQMLFKNDVHVILARLMPREMASLHPILRLRKNFSIVVDDWWSIPHWFMREAEYIIFRNYNGIAVRTGQAALVDGPQPPWLLNPCPQISRFSVIGAALRPAALVSSPLVDAWSWWRRRGEPVNPGRYLYFPFPVNEADVPLQEEKIEYDFANTGGACGIWLMRDPFVSFRHTFANLYYDRQRLTDFIAKFEGNPFKFYDCRRENGLLPYDEYARKNRQSRYLITTGGLQNTSVPKYLEYACAGTPMIGRGLPFEYPWLEDCLFPVDIMRLSPEQTKPLLLQALERYPALRQNCLNWRDRLLKLYDLHTLLDMIQAQADGKPVPPGYLKPAALQKNIAVAENKLNPSA